MNKDSVSKKNTPQKETNTSDVLIRAIDAFYNLVNSGNFIGFILLGILLLLFLIVWCLPPDGLNTHVGTILSFLLGSKYTITLLICSLCVSVTGNFSQRKYYKKEIKRLVKIRSILMHGRKEEVLRIIENHNESEFDLDSDGE